MTRKLGGKLSVSWYSDRRVERLSCLFGAVGDFNREVILQIDFLRESLGGLNGAGLDDAEVFEALDLR